MSFKNPNKLKKKKPIVKHVPRQPQAGTETIKTKHLKKKK